MHLHISFQNVPIDLLVVQAILELVSGSRGLNDKIYCIKVARAVLRATNTENNLKFTKDLVEYVYDDRERLRPLCDYAWSLTLK